MHFTTIQQLKASVLGVAKAGLSTPQVTNIMRFTRMIIEAEGSAPKYPILYMYCHLVHHSTMDRNSEGLKLLEGINDVVITYQERYGLLDAVNVAFKLVELRRELISFLASKNVDMDALSCRSGWRMFLECLFRDIAGRQIKFSDDIESRGSNRRGKEERAIFSRMVEKMRASSPSSGMIAWSFCILFDDKHDMPSIAKGLMWHIKTAWIPLSIPPSTAYDTFPSGMKLYGGVGIMEEVTAFSKGR